MKPGVCLPPPTEPARDENFMPSGIMPGYSRLTTTTDCMSGAIATITSKQPQEVMGSSISE